MASLSSSLSTPPARHPARAYGLPVLVFFVIAAVALTRDPSLRIPFGLMAVLAAWACYTSLALADARRLIVQQATLLHTNEQLFLETLDHATSGLALISPEGKWMQVNQAVCRIVGYTADELMQIDFQTITHPDDLDADLHYVQQVLDKKIEAYSMEKRYIRKDGSLVWILLSVSAAWDAAGNFRHFISRIDDIHERKSLQERLRSNEALQRAQD